MSTVGSVLSIAIARSAYCRAAVSNHEAIRYFDSAIELDPNYAKAYAGRVVAFERMSYYLSWGDGERDYIDRAVADAQQAAATDDSDHLPHMVLAIIITISGISSEPGGIPIGHTASTHMIPML